MQSHTETKQLYILPRAVAAVLCLALVFLGALTLIAVQKPLPAAEQADDIAIMNAFDSLIEDSMNQAEAAALSVPKIFWLSEDATKGLVPNPENYGTTDDPSTLQWLLDEAQALLQGDETLFSTDVTLMPGSEATYYLDESIFAVTWKQVFDNCVYTISEIQLSHPSQFRRHLEGGVIDKIKLSTPTLMSRSVNAVVGSAADHYLGRRAGIIVYDGEVKRVNLAEHVDVCYIDTDGNLVFSYAGDLLDMESAQKFVDEHNISFSLAFGPIIVDNGIRRDISHYVLGEVNDEYARAALCQMGNLHYLVVTANREGPYWKHLTIHEFARQIEQFGCDKAYTLDGGNTGSIVMNGKLINRTTFGEERWQGDLLYFCTAVPNTNETETQGNP